MSCGDVRAKGMKVVVDRSAPHMFQRKTAGQHPKERKAGQHKPGGTLTYDSTGAQPKQASLLITRQDKPSLLMKNTLKTQATKTH